MNIKTRKNAESVCDLSGGPMVNGFLKLRQATGFQNPVVQMVTAKFDHLNKSLEYAVQGPEYNR